MSRGLGDVYKRQELEYHLIDNEIKEVYRVINKDNVMMHFSIGGHPAFVTPENDASMAGCKIRFDADRITYHLIGDYQLMARDEYELPLINHEYTIHTVGCVRYERRVLHLFDILLQHQNLYA